MHLSQILFVDDLKIRMQPSCILQLCGASCAKLCQSAQKTHSTSTFVCNWKRTLQACTILVTSTKHSGTVAAGQPAYEATQPGCMFHRPEQTKMCKNFTLAD